MGEDEFRPGDLVECFPFSHNIMPGFEGESLAWAPAGLVVRGPYELQRPDCSAREFRHPVCHMFYDILVCGSLMEGVDYNSLRRLQVKNKGKNTVKN